MGRADRKTKEFWQDREHFADLFNTVVFHGAQVIDPDRLEEKDSDVSSTVEGKRKYLETVFKARDVVKKFLYGVEFVILGVENQMMVDYTMPMRAMMYDCLGYWRECQMISNKNRKDQKEASLPRLFSFRKSDRIHPIVTLVIYYGETAWDGPRSLHDMMIPISNEISQLVPEYPLHLIEIRASDGFVFRNPDVELVFSLVRKIYRKEIDVEEFCHVRKDLAELVGTIVQSEKIVKMASRSKKEEINMCRALEEMMQERERKGQIEGKIEAYYDIGLSLEQISEKVKIPISEVSKVLGKLAPV